MAAPVVAVGEDELKERSVSCAPLVGFCRVPRFSPSNSAGAALLMLLHNHGPNQTLAMRVRAQHTAHVRTALFMSLAQVEGFVECVATLWDNPFFQVRL